MIIFLKASDVRRIQCGVNSVSYTVFYCFTEERLVRHHVPRHNIRECLKRRRHAGLKLRLSATVLPLPLASSISNYWNAGYKTSEG
jgi:hypothetical protein